MKKTHKQTFAILFTVLGMSSTGNLAEQASTDYIKSDILNRTIEGAISKKGKGSTSFEVLSAKKDWMTKNTIEWECLEMEKPLVYTDAMGARMINVRMEIEVNPNKIPHQVDWAGFMNPYDPVRLKSFDLNFDFKKSFSKSGGIFSTSTDFVAPNKGASKDHSGACGASYYYPKVLENEPNPIPTHRSNPNYVELPLYGADAKNGDGIEAALIPNKTFYVSNEASDSSFSTEWIFNLDDKRQSGDENEPTRMYAEFIEANNKKITLFHPKANTVAFYYSLTFADTAYPKEMGLTFRSTAEIGYDMIGSKTDLKVNDSKEIKIPL